MTTKQFIIKGAKVLAIQEKENVSIYMRYIGCDYIFCDSFEGKLSEITKEEAYFFWMDFIAYVVENENAIIEHFDKNKDKKEEEI